MKTLIISILISLFLVSCSNEEANSENNSETIVAYLSKKGSLTEINITQMSTNDKIPHLELNQNMLDKYKLAFSEVYNISGSKPKDSEFAYRISILTTKKEADDIDIREISNNLIKEKQIIFY